MTDPKQPTFNPNAVGSFPVYVPVRTMQPKEEASHPYSSAQVCCFCGDVVPYTTGDYCSEKCRQSHASLRSVIHRLVYTPMYDENRSAAGEGEL